MNPKYLNDLISVNLIHVGHGVFEEDISYSNIISTFSRIYFIEKGRGKIVLKGKTIVLEEGSIYFVPAFEPCSYLFQKEMSHYFLHCTFSLHKEFSANNLFSFRNKVPSIPIDKLLFERLWEIHPKMDIPHHDPNIYEKKIWMNNQLSFAGFSHYLETTGVIKQLFSRFICKYEKDNSNKHVKLNFQQIFSHIRSNIDKDISVRTLADISYVSSDHFSKVFKATMGIGPCEFILRQRLQTAQLLLLTTEMSLQEICQDLNFKSLSYFSYIFKKYNRISPTMYRKYKNDKI